MKWLTAIAGVAVLALLVWLRHELSGRAVAATIAPASAAPAPSALEAAHPVAPTPASAPAAPRAVASADPAPPSSDAPKKLDPQSDRFFATFDEVVPGRLTREAAACFEGHAHLAQRDQGMKLRFKTTIADGVVTVHDVRVIESTLGDQALEACFVRKVQEASWRNDELPDWTQDDELVLTPERGMKKFMKANLEYDGEGPELPAIIKPGQAPPPRAPRGGPPAGSAAASDW